MSSTISTTLVTTSVVDETQTNHNHGSTTSLDSAAIAGITVACFFAGFIVICIYFFLRQKYSFRKHKKELATPLTTIVTPPTSPVIRHEKLANPNPADHAIKPSSEPHIRPQPKRPHEEIIPPFKRREPVRCLYNNICKQYSISLGLHRKYFNFDYNKCYCTVCYDSAKPDFYTKANFTYTIPRGWTRFGLQMDQTLIRDKKIFQRWHTTFYGTSKDKLEPIINNRFIPFPGDQLLSGKTFTTDLSDKKHVYTSPSINYACLEHVCPIDTVNIDNEWYDIQVVLECKQNPAGNVKQRGCRRDVCRIIPDNEIEWKTDQRSSIVPYGLLIRPRKHHCNEKCVHIHS